MVCVSSVGEWLVVGPEDYFEPGFLQPQAQPAGSAEEVGGQAVTLAPQSLGVSKKRFNVVGVVTVRWKIDERAANEPDTITAALAGFLDLGRHETTISGIADNRSSSRLHLLARVEVIAQPFATFRVRNPIRPAEKRLRESSHQNEKLRPLRVSRGRAGRSLGSDPCRVPSCLLN